MTKSDSPAARQPLISVVVLNYNGHEWLARCFESLERQTIFSDSMEVLTDNKSSDGSDQFAAAWLERTGRAGSCKTAPICITAARTTTARPRPRESFCCFLTTTPGSNVIVWRNFIRKYRLPALMAGRRWSWIIMTTFFKVAANPAWICSAWRSPDRRRTTRAHVCRAGLQFILAGGDVSQDRRFRAELLIYSDETDLAWRAWIAGGNIVSAPDARLHHRGAAVVNPVATPNGGIAHQRNETVSGKPKTAFYS